MCLESNGITCSGDFSPRGFFAEGFKTVFVWLGDVW